MSVCRNIILFSSKLLQNINLRIIASGYVLNNRGYDGRILLAKTYSNNVTVTGVPKQKMSKAMRAYLERAREHDEFMKEQEIEFQIGKRHLANMMGEDPETFTQDDVDEAIEYLFPSGLYDKRARPIMRPPSEIFPQRKAAEFDETGRPYHSMFYTGKPNFFKLLHDIVERMENLNKYEDQMIRKQVTVDPALQINSLGSDWVSKVDLEHMLVEEIVDLEYNNFVNVMNRLIALPYSYRIKDFIDKYRKPLMVQSKKFDIPKPQHDEHGRLFITTYECLRKKARGDVTLRFPGTGLISINNQDIRYFEDKQPREQESLYMISCLTDEVIARDRLIFHEYSFSIEKKKIDSPYRGKN